MSYSQLFTPDARPQLVLAVVMTRMTFRVFHYAVTK